MATWSKDELRKIAEADDLHISPFREDEVRSRAALAEERKSIDFSAGNPFNMFYLFCHRFLGVTHWASALLG